MREFNVTIIERLEKTVTIKAKNHEDAVANALENWLNAKEEYTLDSSNFTGVDFKVLPSDGE